MATPMTSCRAWLAASGRHRRRRCRSPW
jgi:hypothetical protein